MNPYQARLVGEVLLLLLVLRIVRGRGARLWILCVYSIYLLSWEAGGAFLKRSLPLGAGLVGCLWAFSRRKEWAARAGALIPVAFAAFVFAKYDPVQEAAVRVASGASPVAGNRLASLFDLNFLGFSYFFLKYVHLVLEIRRGAVVAPSLRDLAHYFFFFPSFTAGPIDRWRRFSEDGPKDGTTISTDDLDTATKRVILGAFSKFVLGDGLAYLTQAWTLQGADLSTAKAWGLFYGHAGQIYFDFAGYTSIAIGLGGLVGYHLPENFRAPYAQKNLVAFWQNWHITLTGWLRDYLFLPFGQWAMKRPWGRNQILVLTLGQILTMLACGLWHGASWSYVSWGLWHGIGLSVVQIFQMKMREPARKGLRERLAASKGWGLAAHLATFHFVALGWLLFFHPPAEAARISALLLGVRI